MDEPARDNSIVNSLRTKLGTRRSFTSDAELIDRFRINHDEDAFELIVWRYSRMVLLTCRAVLHDFHAAEDAAQAVFLTLARKVSQINNDYSLAGWLHRTAQRISYRAARKQTPRSASTELLMNISDGDKPETADLESMSIIHQEVGRLPEKYRLPILLCMLEGLSRTEAAQQLGWPTGTVDTRIARGKAMLIRRLAHRGVTIPTAGVAALFSIVSVGTVNAGFVRNTVAGALAFAARDAVIPGVSPFSVQLANGVVRSMLFAKIRLYAGIGLIPISILTVGVASAAFEGRQSSGAQDSRDPIAAVSSDVFVMAPIPKRIEVKSEAIDEEIIKAYKVLGATYGGFVNNAKSGSLEFQEGEEAAKKGLPGFRLSNETVKLGNPKTPLPLGKLPELPDAKVPFGLDMSQLAISDDGLRSIEACEHLTYLNVSSTAVGNPGMKSIAKLKNLVNLNLAFDHISEEGIKELKPLTRLSILNLNFTTVTDDLTKAIAELPEVSDLTFGHSREMSVETMKQIAGMKKLSALRLGFVGVTDEGMLQLKESKELKLLELHATRVSNGTVEELKKAHPKLQIER